MLIEVQGLSKRYRPRGPMVVEEISFTIDRGETLAIFGDSGSGKSTILRCIWRTNLPEQGRILYDSARFGLVDLAQATQRQMLYLRAFELGYVSQFLNALPRQTARDIVLKSALEAYGADERARAVAAAHGIEAEPATEDDWETEYLAADLAVRVVGGVDEAIGHVNRYGTKHSEAIVAEDEAAVEAFLARVDAAAVYANASTAFTDGAEFGLGAEIGISTQKLHARGPFALDALTSYKYVLRGSGQVRA